MNVSKSRTIANGVDVTIQEQVDKDSPFDIDAIRAEVVYTDVNNEPKTVAATVILDFPYLQDKYEKELGKSITFDTVTPEELNRFVLDATEDVYARKVLMHPTSGKGFIKSEKGNLRYIPDSDMRPIA